MSYRKKLGLSDPQKWSLDQLQDLRTKVVEELGIRHREEQARKEAAAVTAQRPEPAPEKALKSFEQKLAEEIQDYQRSRRAGVIRI